jgi:DNA primase
MIDQFTIERILDAANIVNVVSEFVTLRKRGVNYVGLCPFHNEKTPSFYVSPAKGICKCFSCGKGGNVIHFLMEHEQMSFYDAAEWLADKYGIPFQRRELTDTERALQNERESLFVVNQFAKDFFTQTLHTPKGKAVGMAYFHKRGFRDDIIEKFQLGYSTNDPDALAGLALKKGYTKENLVKAGVCLEREDGTLLDRFRGRVIFPIHSLSGKIVAFGGRIMNSKAKTAKYVNSPESVIYSKSRELYGIYFAKQAIVRQDRCFLVEGYTDVISMFQAGVENVVASSGTALTAGQIRLIRRFTNNITVLYDGDPAGIKASIRGIDMLLAEGMNVKVLLLPDGEDPDSFAQKHNATAFRQYINKHQVDFIRFKVNLLMSDAADDPISRSELIKEITRSISVIQDPIVRSVYITDCSQLLKVDERLLIADVNKRQREQYRPAVQTPATAGEQLPVSGTSGNVAGNTGENASAAQTDDGIEPELSPEEQLRQDIRRLKQQNLGPIMEKERLLSKLIVRYANRTFCMVDTDEGPRAITVGRFILQSLENDGLEFHHPVYKRFIQLYKEHGEEPGFDSERFFISHPEHFVSLTATGLMEDRYQLSDLFKSSTPGSDDSRLFELTTHIMADYQMELIRLEIRKTEKMLQDPEILDSADKLKQVQTHYQDLLKTRNALAKKLGERVVNL